MEEWNSYRGPSTPYPDRGLWSHLRPAVDDEYVLVLRPVTSDSTIWGRFTVDLVDPVVATEDSLYRLVWARIVDVRVDTLPGGGYLAAYLRERRRTSPFSFFSGRFRLPLPPPGSLEIRVELRVLDNDAGEEIMRIPIRVRAVIETHRRWTIIDAMQS